MRIIKNGRLKRQEWVFKCEDCGCKFIADENDCNADRDGDYVECPTCGAFIDWSLGKEQ